MLTQLALAPAMVLIIFILHFDKYTKEPLWLMVLFFIYGMFSVVPVMAFCACLSKTNLQSVMPLFYTSFLSSALPEEFIKSVFIFFLFSKETSQFTNRKTFYYSLSFRVSKFSFGLSFKLNIIHLHI